VKKIVLLKKTIIPGDYYTLCCRGIRCCRILELRSLGCVGSMGRGEHDSGRAAVIDGSSEGPLE
jgi:hypothetical protein